MKHKYSYHTRLQGDSYSNTIECDEMYIKENSIVFADNVGNYNRKILLILPASNSIVTLVEESKPIIQKLVA